MSDIPREPRKWPQKTRRRLLRRMNTLRFSSLVTAMRLLAAEHLATSSDLRDAASLVAHERRMQLYAIKQGRPKPIVCEDDEDEEEEGEDCEGFIGDGDQNDGVL